MKYFYRKVVGFWFVLLVIALVNATIRETTYKPWLTPLIGSWAHQLSSVTAMIAFGIAIYLFLRSFKTVITTRAALQAGIIWVGLTHLFETAMNMFMRQLTLQQVIESYYFWRGDTLIFVLLSLLLYPVVIARLLQRRKVVI